MPLPTYRTRTRNYRLTGRVKFRDAEERTGFFSYERRVLLRVEETWEEVRTEWPSEPPETGWQAMTGWRDAHALDLASPALRWIFDHGRQP